MAREKLTRTKILMSIFITSAFWLALDMYIFYGFYPLENIARKENLVIKPKMIVNIVTENIDNIEDDTVKDDTTWEEIKDVDKRTLLGDRNGPGEMGRGVASNTNDERVKAGWISASFNEFVSDQISVERSLKDMRNRGCRKQLFPYEELPQTSVIICFTEESWSTLLRTVHSVLNRSPSELIKEVILVDDNSQREYLKEKLDEYISKLKKVKILRLKKRLGLIRARLEGVRVSTGSVLTFLDSHVECNVGWLEPLLFEIWKNRTTVVCPIIDTIHANSFQILPTGTNIRGGFDWHLTFRWLGVPLYEKRRRQSDMDNIKSPTMAGGLFSIDREFFKKLGFYDPGLEIWGGENLELSFKTWMCGGTLLIIPCSRVAHIFRKSQPYKFPKGNMKTFLKNNIRVAEVWLDKYKRAFYNMNPQLKSWSFGDISSRIELKKNLKCRSFDWYLKNVIPELRVPEINPLASGSVTNFLIKRCLDSQNNRGNLILYSCHGRGMSQNFRLTNDGKIESFDLCIGRRTKNTVLTAVDCSSRHAIRWHHRRNGYLQDTSSGFCLTASRDNRIFFSLCSNHPHKKWIFSKYSSRFPL